MSPALKQRIVAAMSGGAIAIATAMVAGKDGLEGREYVPYRDVVGVLTVCDGHTGKDIIPGKRYTDNECDALTQADMTRIARQIDPHIKVNTTDTQRAAIYSFAYNVGLSAAIKSTLMKKLNDGDYVGACNELKRWIYAGGKKWRGLMSRREVEHQVCMWDR
ncbi:lysozyme [Cronobacter sakazakii]|uniref:lysozyme n=1 Tax=Cronobacter sakazakii TaxID=28141 RepID=UPI000CFBCC7A|nr:lysozyme [Cronobacter sakazakii]ELY2510449.1 lysozyme [Cronobacter sakazakii]ELY2631484.1 lysozyme [Cronobacter sakazakii]ELY2635696.1 lysozyme [Cronobacter sakazakii]ELY2660132.1 lysozyme [Cronobacter sakazakii]ELY4636299.1 lysozyme [Cronobacter sakazakii]